jgi:hypothetical protein
MNHDGPSDDDKTKKPASDKPIIKERGVEKPKQDEDDGTTR